VPQDPAEVVAQFKKLKAAGKVKYFGASNYATSQYRMLDAAFKKEGLALATHGE
jgi:predicted oxidoreductase